MKQHKWHKEIKAWADGAEIEYRDLDIADDTWEVCNTPIWDCSCYEFRIKPLGSRYLY